MTPVMSFCGLCVLLALGKLLRVNVRFFQRLYLPSSVIGGLLGLLILQTCGQWISPEWTAGWTKLPGLLINVVFAALFLGVTVPKLSTVWKKAGPQLAYGQIVAWGQYVVGLGLVLAVLGPLFGVPALFGVIVPVGFEGGHGTAGGLIPTFEKIGWAEGADYALASATAGIMSAIIVGMCLINWAVRRGMLPRFRGFDTLSEEETAGIYPVGNRPPAGRQTVMSDSVDSLALHLAIMGIAILVGYLIKQALVVVEAQLPGMTDHSVMRTFPLFPICMIGGLIVQACISRFSRINPVDHGLMQRIAGTALDFLVVAAVSTIRLDVVARGFAPFAALIAAGILWNVFCVMWLAKRMLPDFWFERAMAEMGQSMGVTATGLLLLRVVDPESKTPAPAAFAYKQLLHEPFMGGGLWTSMAVLLVWRQGAWFVFLISVGAIAAWLLIWRLFLMRRIRNGQRGAPGTT